MVDAVDKLALRPETDAAVHNTQIAWCPLCDEKDPEKLRPSFGSVFFPEGFTRYSRSHRRYAEGTAAQNFYVCIPCARREGFVW